MVGVSLDGLEMGLTSVAIQLTAEANRNGPSLDCCSMHAPVPEVVHTRPRKHVF